MIVIAILFLTNQNKVLLAKMMSSTRQSIREKYYFLHAIREKIQFYQPIKEGIKISNLFDYVNV